MHGEGAYRGATGTLTGVEVIIVALVLLVGLLGGMLLVRERDRRAALAALGEVDESLAVAARRTAQRRVPREELSAALALRDAVLAAAPYPVLLFDVGACLVRANAAARRLLPAMTTGEPAEPPQLATAVRDALGGPHGTHGRPDSVRTRAAPLHRASAALCGPERPQLCGRALGG